MKHHLLAAIAGASLFGTAAVAQTAPDPAALAGLSASAQGAPSSQADMNSRNSSILTTFIGTEPIYENKLDVITQLDFQMGTGNTTSNTISGRDTGGSGGPTVGNSIGAATQFNAQLGNHNTGLNNAGLNFYRAGSVPEPLSGLVSNDIFVGTQVNVQLGHDNHAGNHIDTNRHRNGR